MADYDAITDLEIEPEKPITTSLMNRLRDNPLAIAEGTTGAPQIQGTAGAGTGAVDWSTFSNEIPSTALKTTTAERDWVLARTAAAAVGTVGTYAFLNCNIASSTAPGGTRPGANLEYAAASGPPAIGGTIPSGTWRCMGQGLSNTSNQGTTLWLRVS